MGDEPKRMTQREPLRYPHSHRRWLFCSLVAGVVLIGIGLLESQYLNYLRK